MQLEGKLESESDDSSDDLNSDSAGDHSKYHPESLKEKVDSFFRFEQNLKDGVYYDDPTFSRSRKSDLLFSKNQKKLGKSKVEFYSVSNNGNIKSYFKAPVILSSLKDKRKLNQTNKIVTLIDSNLTANYECTFFPTLFASQINRKLAVKSKFDELFFLDGINPI